MQQLAHWLKICKIKVSHWEYWNSAIIYIPVLPYLVYLWVRAKNIFFFNAANPGIEYGGFLMESKWQIHVNAPAGFFPETVKVNPFQNYHSTIKYLFPHLQFPLIAKPDIGSRGRGVAVVENLKQLRAYHEQCPVSYLLQEKVDYPNEAGIFYVRSPGELAGKITGIVIKEYMTVTGNGRDSLRDLLKTIPRYLLQLHSLEKLLGNTAMQYIVPAGKIHTVIDIGNHARGAKFINGKEKITIKLTETIDALCKQITGFYFGRLDIRFKDWHSLERGVDFAIIEMNGAGSEPTHIYDPSSSMLSAWLEICRHWKMIYQVSKFNHDNGVAYLHWKEAFTMFRNNADLNKKLAFFL